jgi:polar amino acid transport system substrate-binding protein
MRALYKQTPAAFVLAFFLSTAAYAQSYKVAVAQIPTTEYYKNLAMAIAESSGLNFDIQAVPLARSVYLIENKQIDLSLPMLAMKDSDKVKALDYDYSTTVLCRSCFVLVTNKAKPVDIDDLKKGNSKRYKIEADVSMANQFEFTALPSTNAEASLRKVSDGTIDGYIHGQAVTDAALKAIKALNLKRQFYENLDLVCLLQKGSRGGPIDTMISDSIKKLKDSGQYEKIMGSLIKALTYDDWQP